MKYYHAVATDFESIFPTQVEYDRTFGLESTTFSAMGGQRTKLAFRGRRSVKTRNVLPQILLLRPISLETNA